jgi:hypothetical protein
MTIERLSELFQKGYYSKIDFYLALLSILSQTGDPDRQLEAIPRPLIDEIIDIVERHSESAKENRESQGAELPMKILEWHRKGARDRWRKNGIEDRTSIPHSARELSDEWRKTIPLSSIQDAEAINAIQRLERSHGLARSIAHKLRDAVEQRSIEVDDLAQHSRWCHSASSYRDSVEPAQKAALAMYGFVPDRLINEDEGRVPNYRKLVAMYRERLASRRTIP